MGTVAISDKSRPTSPELFKVGDELLSGWALASLSFNGWKDMARQPRRTEDDGGRCEEEIRDRCGDNVCLRDNFEPRLHSPTDKWLNFSLESGMLYPTVQLARTILNYTYTIGPIPIDIGPLSTQAAGIAPTLIIARAAGGRSFRSMYPTRTPSTVASRMQFADADGTRARIPRRSADLEVQLGARTSLSYSDASPDLESPSQRTGKGKEQATI
ncbi:hypothetical protein PQX77_012220 [Marasmius sp. AFHP31]|nr:hypothetical protein PQX77_012220 [Marasmius sp. AFHP31]